MQTLHDLRYLRRCSLGVNEEVAAGVDKLTDRVERRGPVLTERAERDRRQVRVRLARRGERLRERLAARHRRELLAAGPTLVQSLVPALASQAEPPWV